MRTRRQVLVGLGAALAAPLVAFAQKPGRVWRVGFLAARRRPESLDTDFYGEVPRGLRELGYVEGKNLVIEWRFADGRNERLPGLAAELVRLNVDVIVTDGTPGTLAAQKATRKIPIVFGGAGDPVGNGLVRSLARPGGNTTGLALLAGDTGSKQVEMLSRMVPRLFRVAAFWNPTNPLNLPVLKNVQAAADTTKVKLLPVEVRSEQEIENAFSLLARERAEALILLLDPFFIQQRRQIAELATMHRLPSIAGFREYVEAGGLMSYGQSRTAYYHRVATYIDKIFKGANPGDLPVEQSMTLELILNRRTAKALGLTIPPDLLVLADKVIE